MGTAIEGFSMDMVVHNSQTIELTQKSVSLGNVNYLVLFALTIFILNVNYTNQVVCNELIIIRSA